MNLTLSWDLFAIVFFALVVTYTFIIGRKESVKIMIACYIAIVAVQGIGNALLRFMSESGSVLSVVGLTTLDTMTLTIIKLVLFVAIVVFLTVRSGIDVVYAHESNPIITMVVTALFGVATGGLLLSTLLTYITGTPLLDATLASNVQLSSIIQQSQIMQLMIQNQDLWFAFPALMLGAVGFLHNA
jgi:hypothetical protein